MSVPTAELTAPAPSTDVAAGWRALARWLSGGRLYVVLGGAALVIGALSLLIPSTPSYDPWAWLVWGREIVHINLQTTGGPSWKPLPVVFTTIFSLFGHAQPDLWLVLARAGAVMAALMAFKLARRLTLELTGLWREGSGRGDRAWATLPALLAGLIAAASLINSRGFITDNALGYSEGLMTALVLIALDRHLDGARRQAFAVGFFAALDRPELWFLWGPYGLYLWWKDPGARKLVVALFALIPVLWFLPELWGSGHLFRGVTRAQHPRSNSPAFAKCPFCTEFAKHAWPTVLLRVKAPAVLALLAAAVGLWRTRDTWWRGGPVSAATRARAALLLLGVVGWAWWIGIAVETQAGFSGNDQYLVLGTALVSIAGGVGWGWGAQTLAGWLRRWSARPLVTGAAGTVAAAVVLVAVPPWFGPSVIDVPATHHALVYQAHLREDLTAAVRKAGGADALLRCGPIMTEGFQVPMTAWTLGVHTLRVEATPTASGLAGPPWPAVILQTRAQSRSTLLPTTAQIHAWERDGARYHLVAHVRTFRVFSTCAGRVKG